MKIAISNIAWRPDEERQVADLLVARGIRGVEVAPGKIGSHPRELTDREVRDYREFWNSRGISIVAMQALLFGAGDLLLFGSSESRRALRAYLARIIGIGSMLGARVLVFGSPGNRRKGVLSQEEAEEIAIPFFRDSGDDAHSAGVRICIEANPAIYGCDFLVNTREASEFVEKVDHPGFGLHIDAAAMAFAGEPPEDLAGYRPPIRHFHASEIGLGPVVGAGGVAHAQYARALRGMGYGEWVSIEMREACSPDSNLDIVTRAVDFVRSTYGD